MIERLFEVLGTTGRFFVEFGAKDGFNLSNTALLRLHRGWRGLLLDPGAAPGSPVTRGFVTAENVNALFREHGVPREFDLLSIDVDGNEYWIWKALRDFRPRVVVIEYNVLLDPLEAKVAPYDPSHAWDGSAYHGASLAALQALGRRKGYALVYTDSYAPNAFFVRRDTLPRGFREPALERVAAWSGLGEPADLSKRTWVRV